MVRKFLIKIKITSATFPELSKLKLFSVVTPLYTPEQDCILWKGWLRSALHSCSLISRNRFANRGWSLYICVYIYIYISIYSTGGFAKWLRLCELWGLHHMARNLSKMRPCAPARHMVSSFLYKIDQFKKERCSILWGFEMLQLRTSIFNSKVPFGHDLLVQGFIPEARLFCCDLCYPLGFCKPPDGKGSKKTKTSAVDRLFSWKKSWDVNVCMGCSFSGLSHNSSKIIYDLLYLYVYLCVCVYIWVLPHMNWTSPDMLLLQTRGWHSPIAVRGLIPVPQIGSIWCIYSKKRYRNPY